MTDEERQRAMDFIANQTASNAVTIEKLLESHRKAENRLDLCERRLDRDDYLLDRYERLLKFMIRAGRRERRTRSEADERLTKAMAELAEQHKQTEASIAHTDSKLDTLVNIVRRQHNGGTQVA